MKVVLLIFITILLLTSQNAKALAGNEIEYRILYTSSEIRNDDINVFSHRSFSIGTGLFYSGIIKNLNKKILSFKTGLSYEQSQFLRFLPDNHTESIYEKYLRIPLTGNLNIILLENTAYLNLSIGSYLSVLSFRDTRTYHEYRLNDYEKTASIGDHIKAGFIYGLSLRFNKDNLFINNGFTTTHDFQKSIYSNNDELNYYNGIQYFIGFGVCF